MADEEAFKVTDRRGRARESEPAGAGATAPPGSSAEPSPAPADAPGRRPPADLSALFAMLASSALMSLGEAPDPGTGERVVDLEQAQEVIDLLLLLRDKTTGNRTEPESRLLEQILYDLQMRFVEATRRR
jgi:hypothetical protein